MKYQFHEHESYIFDLLTLPQHIHYKEDDYEKMDENYDELIPEEAKINVREFQKILLPYKDKLLPYYYESTENHDFIYLLSMTQPLIGQESVEGYLEKLENLTERELLYSVYYALDYYERDTKEDKALSKEAAERLLEHPEEVMAFLQKLSIGNDAKWHLLNFSTQPKTMVSNLVGVLREIHPQFQKLYETKKAMVLRKGEEITQRLLSAKGDGLAEISNGIMKESILNWTTYPLVVSLSNPMQIMLNTGNIHPFIAWGVYLDDIFKAMQEQEENRVQERVLLFKNLGDKTRYEVVMSLARGITSTKVIAKNLEVSPATISYHLNNLVTAKIAYLDQVDGRYIYKVNEEFLNQAIAELKKDFLL